MIKIVTLGLAAMAAVALVACGGGGGTTTSSTQAAAPPAGGGGGGSSSGGGATSSVKLAADPSQIAYDTSSLTAKAGNVTIDFNNPNSALQHDVCVEAQGENDLGCSQKVTGGSATLDLKNLKPGTYTFYCSVDSHRQAGMEGTLTVQ